MHLVRQLWQSTALAAVVAVYPLDAEPRTLAADQALPCGVHGLTTYAGTGIKYSTPARVHPAFVEHLKLLDALVIEVSVKYYGRAPRKLVHLGTYNCRRIRTYPDWISEHAFGNAIDLAGLDFSAYRGELPEGAPRSIRRGFQVRMLDHWNGKGTTNSYHSRFLRELAQRLIDRRDIFRGVLGPAWPGHRNHLHLDMAPYRVVEVFSATEAR